EDFRNINWIGITFQEQSASRMRQHRNERILHGPDHAAGHLNFTQIEYGMNGRNDVIELCQDFVWKIKRTVAQNVTFHARKKAKAAQLVIQCPNAGDLEAQLRFVQSMCLRRASAMVCDSEVLESQLLCSFRHLLDGVVPIACGRVTMKRTAQVFLLNKFWQRMVLSGFEFTPILPKLRRNKTELD